MAHVTVYSSPFCPYCFIAKRLLCQKGAEIEEIDVVAEPKRRSEMVARAGGRNTVPQIFIGDRHVGGCDDLKALEAAGKLDTLLAQAI
jgi:glutaredoxin 3